MDTWATASEIAGAIATGKTTATEVVDRALATIATFNPALNAFTDVTAARARAKARAIDQAGNRNSLPLAGVPFAVKNLFDVEGLPTRVRNGEFSIALAKQ